MIRLRHALVLSIALAACKSNTPVLRAACDAGSADACAVVAARLLLGTDGKPDEAEATKFFKRELELRAKACAAGDQEQCTRMTARGMAMAPTPLDLPKASAGSDIQLVLAIELRADGTTHVDGKPVADDAALLAAAQKAVAATQDVRAIIRADTSVQHGRVIRALDLLKQAGIVKIAFGVTPVAPDAGAPR